MWNKSKGVPEGYRVETYQVVGQYVLGLPAYGYRVYGPDGTLLKVTSLLTSPSAVMALTRGERWAWRNAR